MKRFAAGDFGTTAGTIHQETEQRLAPLRLRLRGDAVKMALDVDPLLVLHVLGTRPRLPRGIAGACGQVKG